MDQFASSMTRPLAVVALGLALAAAGCQAFQKQSNAAADSKSPAQAADAKPSKPGVPVDELLANWDHNIELGTNPVDHTPMAALMGRVNFIHKDAEIGAAGLPKETAVAADGELTIELFDETHRQPNKPSQRLGSWTIDPKQLARLESKDAMLGTGYTLALPWPTYTPEITQVHVSLRYTPRIGQPIIKENPAMTVEPSSEMLTAHAQLGSQTVPAAAQTVPTSATH
jgi:hypothetical protein